MIHQAQEGKEGYLKRNQEIRGKGKIARHQKAQVKVQIHRASHHLQARQAIRPRIQAQQAVIPEVAVRVVQALQMTDVEGNAKSSQLGGKS